ncbi:Shedu immune nuclease family protein [Polaribacter sp. 11A2H]|uniref:Shedu immune nuclease family protein n=1 Tax=Polaribacter sp. 11A2H TaxID=2687290 RepID=UPI00140A097C|nr:Shedu immune nuclease family protein [Polaribacter sp. 11A2H]
MDIFSTFLTSDDNSNFNMHDFTSLIQIDRNENNITCEYICEIKKERKKTLVDIDILNNITVIYPINTIENSTYYLKSKYNITKLVFEGYEIDIQKTDSHDDAIYGLPKGFTKTLKFGLGFEKKYKIILSILSQHLQKCEKVTFSTIQKSNIKNNEIIISDDDYDKIRRGIDRNHDLFNKESYLAKESFIHNTLLHSISPDKYPELKREPRKDIIYKILRNTNFNKISKNDKQSISELKYNTDLSYLSILASEFEEILTNNHVESRYQKFFEENPLLLTMISGSPYIQFNNQAYIGGKSFDNSEGQYPDFLHKHKITNNTFIIEIKRPGASLLAKKPYRGKGVFSASKDLSGSISQILTQKYQLETDIASLIKNSDDRNVEAYNVQGIVIIGKLSNLEEKKMKRSFELFRNNQKNIKIITYDECLEQLNFLINILEENNIILSEDDNL